MKSRHRRPGQSLVEFAMVMPVLFLVIFGTMEVGWLVFANHQVANGTREATRLASVRGNLSSGGPIGAGELKDRILETTSGLDAGALTVSAPTSTWDPGDTVTIAVQYRYTPLISSILGRGSITLSQESTVIVHH